MDIKERVGQRLRDWRKAQGLTQAELGACLGISGPAVYAIEVGRNLSFGRAAQIAALIGVTVDELLRGEPEHAATQS